MSSTTTAARSAASNFSLHVKSGATDVSGSPQAGAESPGTAYTLNTGTYNVSENSVSGYSQSYSGDCNSSGDVTLPAAGSKTCTITNNDIAPKLTVIKHVINDNGGTADRVELHDDRRHPGTNPPNFPGAESPGTNVTVDAGRVLRVRDGPIRLRDDAVRRLLRLDRRSAQTKTCTITNNDIAPKLIVIKHVINDNGGTASAAELHDDGRTSPARTRPTFAGAESPGTNVAVNPGAYTRRGDRARPATPRR